MSEVGFQGEKTRGNRICRPPPKGVPKRMSGGKKSGRQNAKRIHEAA